MSWFVSVIESCIIITTNFRWARDLIRDSQPMLFINSGRSLRILGVIRHQKGGAWRFLEFLALEEAPIRAACRDLRAREEIHVHIWNISPRVRSL